MTRPDPDPDEGDKDRETRALVEKSLFDLRKASARLTSVLESLSDAFFTLDDQWRFTYLNRACENLLGRPREQLLGKRIGEEFPPARDDAFWPNYRLARKENRPVEFEAFYEPLGLWVEVRVHPTETELAVTLRDVTERRKEREVLRQSVERFRGVARATSDAIWDWDLETDAVWWSEGMETLFGHPLAELEPDSRSWTSRIHPEDNDRTWSTIRYVIEHGGDEWTHEYRFARRDGTWAWVQDNGFVVRDGQGRAVRMVGGMTDLSVQRQADLERAQLTRALRMRSACSEAVIRAVDENELLSAICRIAVEIGGYCMAWVGYAEDDARKSIRPVASAGHDEGYLDEVHLSWSEDEPAGRGPAGRAVRSGRPEVLEDMAESPAFTPWRETALRRGYRGVACLPLRSRGRALGLLALYSDEVRPIGREEVELLQALANDLAFGVTSLRSRNAQERMQAAVATMASAVSASGGDEFFLQLARSMAAALGADIAFVARVLPGDPPVGRTIALVVDGVVQENASYLIEATPCRLLLEAEEAVVLDGVAEQFDSTPELAALGARAYVGRRLDGPAGDPLGVTVALFRRRPTDLEFLTSTMRVFASRAAAELERSRREAQDAEQTAILERIATGSPLPDVVEAAARLMESQVEGAACAISLLEEAATLRLLRAPPLAEEFRAGIAAVPIGPAAGVCGTAAYERRTVVVSDMASDPLTADFRELTSRHGIRAGWAVPFFGTDGRVLGTYTLYLPVARPPAPAELELLSTCARLTGIAVERDRAVTALRASEARVRSTFASAAAGIAISTVGPGGQFVLANRAFCEMLGYSENELRQLDFTSLTHPDDLAATMELASRLFSGEVEDFVTEKRYLRKDGGVVWARLSVSMVPADGGTPASIIAVTQDITALKEAEGTRRMLEAQLREAQKMEAIGTLAGGIAHDFNNILGAILGNADLARHAVGENPDALECLAEIRRAGLRARDLIRQILTFSRRDPAVLRAIAPGPVVDESVRLLRATLPTRAPFEVHRPEDLPPISGDPVQIQQVLLNLGTNAVHAMTGRSGAVEFRVEVVDVDTRTAACHAGLREGAYVRVSVEDSGCGMDEETRSRIFEPFFTTKPVGEGTGLGLPVAHGIMQAHGGVILASSTPGVGSRFDLYFPVLASTAAEPDSTPSESPAARGDEGKGRRILYIDDDVALLTLVRRMLSRRGYHVVALADPQQGVEAVRARPGHFDLVLSDYNMPRISGLDVARAVREIRADLPVVVASGFLSETLRAESESAGVRALIFKPNFVEELCDAIARLVEEPGS